MLSRVNGSPVELTISTSLAFGPGSSFTSSRVSGVVLVSPGWARQIGCSGIGSLSMVLVSRFGADVEHPQSRYCWPPGQLRPG